MKASKKNDKKTTQYDHLKIEKKWRKQWDKDQTYKAEATSKKKKYYVLSGIMPSYEKIHFGTKMVVENIRYFQEHGAQTYILVADLEAASTRGVTLEEARKRGFV